MSRYTRRRREARRTCKQQAADAAEVADRLGAQQRYTIVQNFNEHFNPDAILFRNSLAKFGPRK